ncbi:MAG: carboxypeptidase-like regulatory domain-containing protein, partial [Tunicatimonas sp.]|uniref:carboxypeptidase-like regulatory domain-containing protein n=1 Tax=Tunicatimonas sp. TaxID=1940096 RepID=UPI003C79062C
MKHVHHCIFLIFLLVSVVSGLSAQQLASAAEVGNDYFPLQKKKKALSGIILSLGNQYQVRFNFNSQLVKDKFVEAELVAELPNESLDAALDKLLLPLSLAYRKISSSHYVIIAAQQKKQEVLPILKEKFQSVKEEEEFQRTNLLSKLENQSLQKTQQTLAQTISGRITDQESGDGLPGVNILVKETTTGTVTDIDGNYKLTVSDDANTLVYSSIGYATKEVDIRGRAIINLALMPDVQGLEEVVVIGYGVQKKESVVGSIVQTTGEVLQQSGGVSSVG